MSPNNNRASYVWGILATTLCGLKIKIISSSVKSHEGVEGIIVDETSKLLEIKVNNKIKKFPKEALKKVKLTLPDNTEIITVGKILLGKPEDRLKTKIKLW